MMLYCTITLKEIPLWLITLFCYCCHVIKCGWLSFDVFKINKISFAFDKA